jgi:GT2 family glycosyltransferase
MLGSLRTTRKPYPSMTPKALDRGEPPLLSILIVNYNGLRHLDECLSSIRGQDFTDHEVVLVDNASADGSREFVRERFPEVRLVESGSNLGFAGGNNHGLPHCRGAFVFFLNNDTRLEPGALAAIAAAVRLHPDFRVFACLMLDYRRPNLVDNAGETYYRFGVPANFGGYPAALFAAPREVIGACGGAAVYARAVLDRVGAFDEDLFLLYEDLDLSFRARHGGERIRFLPDARVRHKGSATIGGALGPIGVYYTTRNYPQCLAKNFPALTLLKCLPGILLGFANRFRQSARQGLLGPYFRGLADGLKMLPASLGKRRAILRASRIDRREFERLMRQGWLRERLAFRRGGRTLAP